MKRGRPKEERVKLIPLDQINPPSVPVRTSMSREKLDELKSSIKSIGLQQPIVVKKSGSGKYEIVIGERRYVAHQEIKEAAIRCIITEAKGFKAEIAKWHENEAREDINAVDEARFISRLNKLYDMSQAEIAASIGKSEGYVSQRVSIMNAPVVVLEALEDQVISFSVARELSLIDDDAELQVLLQYAIANGVTPAVARAWRLQYEARKEMIAAGGLPGQPVKPEDLEAAKNYFLCEACGNETEFGRMKIVKVCPKCSDTLRETE